MNYAEAIAATSPERIGRPAPDTDAERDAMQRFATYFQSLTVDRVKQLTKETYAENAWFYDTLKTVEGADAIERYMTETAEGVHECTVEIDDFVRSGDDHYARWTMTIRFKKFRKGEPCRSVGMTHLRFNAAGQIALHHDYWDAASGLFEHIPVLGGGIRMVKRRV